MKLRETMTTEGRPELKGSEEYWKKSFEEQRACRLADSVDEYMQDGEVSQFYEDLTNALEELISYHEKQKYHAQLAMKAISGHRPLQMQQEKDLTHEYNRREAEYYDKRAQLDIEHSIHYWDTERNKDSVSSPKPNVVADGYSYKEIPDRF